MQTTMLSRIHWRNYHLDLKLTKLAMMPQVYLFLRKCVVKSADLRWQRKTQKTEFLSFKQQKVRLMRHMKFYKECVNSRFNLQMILTQRKTERLFKQKL